MAPAEDICYASHMAYTRLVSTDAQLGAAEPPSRNPGSLQSRLSGLIRPDVSLFASCLDVAKAEAQSGWGEQEYTDEALNRFTAKREQLNANALRDYEEGLKAGTIKTKSKPRVRSGIFRLHHCHEVLRTSVRFMRGVPQPRKRVHSSCTQAGDDEASDNSEVQTDQIFAVDDENSEETRTSDVMQSPVSSGMMVRPTSAGKKKAKRLQLESQVDKAITHAQRELAMATMAQMAIMKDQLDLAKKKVVIMENQQQTMRDQAEMSILCTSTDGLSEVGKEYLLIKQRQILQQLKEHSENE